jgi:hypothetical protein
MKTVILLGEAVADTSDRITYNWSTTPLAGNSHYPANKVQN